MVSMIQFCSVEDEALILDKRIFVISVTREKGANRQCIPDAVTHGAGGQINGTCHEGGAW